MSAGLEDLMATAFLRAAGEGDLNADGVYDLLDAVRTVQVILEAEASRFEVRAADLNRDGQVDILDLAQLIGRILGAPIGGAKPAPPGLATFKRDGTILKVDAPVALRAILLTVEGAVEDLSLVRGGAGHLAVRRTAPRSLTALLYTLSGEGLNGKEGQVEIGLSIRPEAEREGVRVVGIQGVDLRGFPVEIRETLSLPTACTLSQNRPNPFNPDTVLRYTLPREERVVLRVFSSLGQEVVRLVDRNVPAGDHRTVWNGQDRYGRTAASGVYLGCLEAGPSRSVVKMVLLR